MEAAPRPDAIRLHRRSQVLELNYGTQRYHLSAEFLRVYSPSAEVKGHGPGQEVLQTGKKGVAITQVLAQGNYAIKLVFSDGHDSGIYTWAYLAQLAEAQEKMWNNYLQRLEAAGQSRDPDEGIVKFV